MIGWRKRYMAKILAIDLGTTYLQVHAVRSRRAAVRHLPDRAARGRDRRAGRMELPADAL